MFRDIFSLYVLIITRKGMLLHGHQFAYSVTLVVQVALNCSSVHLK